MTENDTLLGGLTGESSRRSFMKKSAIASGGLAVGLSGTGTLAAKGGNQQGGVMRGLMFNTQFYPRGRFRIISDAIDWAPVESDEEGNNFLGEPNDQLLFDNPEVFAQFNTRIIEYQGSVDNWGMLFVHESANAQRDQVYQLSPAFNPFGRDDFEQFGIGNDVDDDLFNDDGGNQLGLVTVQFSPAGGDGGGGGQDTTTPGDGADGNETAGNETDGNETDGGN